MAHADPLWNDIENMRNRLAEALEALEAIRSGHVDALVVYREGEEQVYTLQGAEQPYRVMVEAMNEGAVTLSADGLILWANRCFADLVGSPLEQLLGTPILDYLAESCRADFEARIKQFPVQSSKIEVALQPPSGTALPALVSVSPLPNPSHSASSCLIVTDLSEQKRSAEIEAAERMAAAIIEQSAEAMVVCGRDGHVVRASQSAYRLAGRDPLAQPFEVVFPIQLSDGPPEGILSANGQAADRGVFSLAAVLDGAVVHGVEACLDQDRPEQGSIRRSLLVSAAPLYLSADQIWGCVITLTDLTALKMAEEEILTYAWQLERSNKDLEDFAFIASHDLQEPLRKIRAFSASLRDRYADQLGHEGIDYLQRMQNAEERMRRMIEELLEYSRVTTRARPAEQVDLNQVVRDVLTDLEYQITRTGGKAEVERLPVIEADPTQMRQLLQNVLSNAFKFHRKDVPPLVRVRADAAGSADVKILVEDNGIGFPMDRHEQVFQPFHRLHGRSEYEGTGIGLAICRRIVERHKGAITAESVPGQGTTIIVQLPRRQESARRS